MTDFLNGIEAFLQSSAPEDVAVAREASGASPRSGQMLTLAKTAAADRRLWGAIR
jgi:hypothetical protein